MEEGNEMVTLRKLRQALQEQNLNEKKKPSKSAGKPLNTEVENSMDAAVKEIFQFAASCGYCEFK